MTFRRLMAGLAVPAAVFAWMAAGTQGARAEYEVESADVEQGELEIEYQGDYGFGTPRRRFIDPIAAPDDPDENEYRRQGHNIGLNFGLTNWLRFGAFAEFEAERYEAEGVEDDGLPANGFGNLKFGGIEFELTAVVIPTRQNGLGVAMFAELELPRESDEPNSISFGPILTFESGAWSVTTNTLLTKDFNAGGEADERDEKWGFFAAWQVQYQVNTQLALAVEGYHDWERIGDSGNPDTSAAKTFFGDQDQHFVGPVVFYTFNGSGGNTLGMMRAGKGDDDDDKAGAMEDDDDDEGGSFTMGVGVLFGLNDETQDTVLKWSAELEF